MGWSHTWIPETFLCNPPNGLPPFPVSLFLPLPQHPTFPLGSQQSLRPLSAPAQWPRVFSSNYPVVEEGARARLHQEGSSAGGGGLAGSALTQPSLPGATLSPASLPIVSAAAGGGEGPTAPQSRSLRRRLPIRVLPGRPSSSLATVILPTYPAAALGGRRRSGSEKGRGEREREERRAVAGGGGAATWYRGRPGAPELGRARASRRGSGGGRSCGRSERRAERGVGGRASRRAGGRGSSVFSSICGGRVCPKLRGRRTDISPGGRTRALASGSGPASARLGACSARLLRQLTATPAPAASTRRGLKVREPLSTGRSPRGSQPRPPRRGPELRPRSPASLRATLSNGAPGLQTRAAGASVFMNPEDVREALQGS